MVSNLGIDLKKDENLDLSERRGEHWEVSSLREWVRSLDTAWGMQSIVKVLAVPLSTAMALDGLSRIT